MPIHIGKKIREELYRQRMPVSEFSRRINRSRNVVYNIFERESVDTALLHTIGKVLSCDFFSAYSAQKEYSQPGIRSFHIVEPETQYGKNQEVIQMLQHQNQLLKAKVNYLERIIELMEKGKPKKSSRKK